MDHISIVIVHYNTDKDTRECLDSLEELEAKNFKYHIIVVDNASKEPLKLTHKQLENNVELLRSESNLGFTGGNNIGIRHAINTHNSDYILLLNSDTVVTPDFLEKLYKYAETEPEIGLVNPKIYFAKGYEYHKNSYAKAELGSVLWYVGGSIDWLHLLSFHRGIDEVDRGHFDSIQETDFATGCCVLIKREVFEHIGPLNERLFLYSEDVDVSLRAQRAGFKTMLCPSAVIWHKNAGSSQGAGSNISVYYQTRNRLYIGLKYGTWRAKWSALRLIGDKLLNGTKIERKAVQDLLTRNLGKQPII
ncbi:MAG TPA: glycosyltransferase family 2 protein [Patescibacteria group bacterium]